MKYRIYIDEVGNSDLDSSDDPNHRFLSITGAIVELGYASDRLHPDLEALKAEFFEHHPDDPLCLHRKELVNQRGPFSVLRDETIRRRFDVRLLSLFNAWEYTVITVCLDKKKHKETYSTWRYDPYHYCLAVLLERYLMFLQAQQAQGDVLAESRGGKEDRRLKDSYERLWRQGTQYIQPSSFQKHFTSRQLKVKQKSSNIAGLQLADLIAHPSRNEILSEQAIPNIQLAPFAQQVVAILALKYHKKDGDSYGKKYL